MPTNNPSVSCQRCGREAVALGYLHAIGKAEFGACRVTNTRRLGPVCEACSQSLVRLTAVSDHIVYEEAPLWENSSVRGAAQ